MSDEIERTRHHWQAALLALQHSQNTERQLRANYLHLVLLLGTVDELRQALRELHTS